MMSAIAIQEQAVEAILSAREQGERAACFGMTLLNRNPRTRDDVMRSCGLTKVIGPVSGRTYWE